MRGLVLRSSGRGTLTYGWGFMVFKEPPESVEFSVKLMRDLGLCGERPLVITVGDVVSRNFARYGYSDVAIMDGKTRRGIAVEGAVEGISYRCVNPPGVVSRECWDAVSKAIRSAESGTKSAVLVEGEEDLLSLVALKECPLDAGWVVYGHWRGFLCLLPCTGFFKKLADVLLESYFEEKGFD